MNQCVGLFRMRHCAVVWGNGLLALTSHAATVYLCSAIFGVKLHIKMWCLSDHSGFANRVTNGDSDFQNGTRNTQVNCVNSSGWDLIRTFPRNQLQKKFTSCESCYIGAIISHFSSSLYFGLTWMLPYIWGKVHAHAFKFGAPMEREMVVSEFVSFK